MAEDQEYKFQECIVCELSGSNEAAYMAEGCPACICNPANAPTGDGELKELAIKIQNRLTLTNESVDFENILAGVYEAYEAGRELAAPTIVLPNEREVCLDDRKDCITFAEGFNDALQELRALNPTAKFEEQK